MTLAVWSFTPQGVAAQHYSDGVHLDYPAPAVALHGAPDSATVIDLTLHYPLVASADVRSLVSFYRTHEGPFAAFSIPDPILHPYSAGADVDLLTTHPVRFVGPLRVTLRDDGLFSVGPIQLRVLVGSSV